jgi:polar amino acid transport system substrate-binding protein
MKTTNKFTHFSNLVPEQDWLHTACMQVRHRSFHKATRIGQTFFVTAVTTMILFCSAPASSQTTISPNSLPHTDRELVIGTKDAPPFSMKAADGTWQGISIELWRRAAEEMRLRYRFVEEATVQDLINGVSSGKFDVAVAAVTITAAREQVVDFSHPFYTTGLGIAVPTERVASWLPVLRSMTSFGFAQAVLALIGLAVLVGFLIWLFERSHNEHFSGDVKKGLSSGVLWSTTAMTQRQSSAFSPRTLPGRIIAIVWMVVSIIAVAVFTAGITSALTTKKLRGDVDGVGDLTSVRVGAVTGTSTVDTLARLHITTRGFETAQLGLKALRQGTIDAFVYDRPLLAWAIRQNFSWSIDLLDTTFDPQSYAFVLPNASPYRKALNVALLKATSDNWWSEVLSRHLGSK